jgi:5-methylcytosine-specific restriction protein A
MRREFTKSVKRAALDRAKGQCEAVGPLYGLAPGVRCNARLDKGINFDHVNGDSNGGEPTLENCAATCPPCNQFKNNNTDTPRAAKTKRMSDKFKGITKSRNPMPYGRGSKFKRKFNGEVVER